MVHTKLLATGSINVARVALTTTVITPWLFISSNKRDANGAMAGSKIFLKNIFLHLSICSTGKEASSLIRKDCSAEKSSTPLE